MTCIAHEREAARGFRITKIPEIFASMSLSKPICEFMK